MVCMNDSGGPTQRMTANKIAIKRQCANCGRELGLAGVDVCPFDRGHLELVYHDDFVHTIFDEKYQITEFVGSGGWSSIYKAQQLSVDRIVALKILHRHLIKDQDKVQRFAHEARAASKLSHPNIVVVYDQGMNPQPYIVMDFVSGVALGERLAAEGPMQVEPAIEMFRQICAGVQSAHNAGIIHRDLKPNNIILMETATDGVSVKVTDFGIAKIFSEQTSDLTRTGETMGSPSYMSPEQCRGDRLDTRSDVYSLGCLMYETITGVRPFDAENNYLTMHNHIHNSPPMPSSLVPAISPAIEQIILRCLEKHPEDRFQSMQEVAQALEVRQVPKRIPVKARRVLVQTPAIMGGIIGGGIIGLVAMAAISYLVFAATWKPGHDLIWGYPAQNLDAKDQAHGDSDKWKALMADAANAKDYGNTNRAEELLTLASDEARLIGPQSLEMADTLDQLSHVYSMQWKPELAEKVALDSLEMRKKLLHAEHPDVLKSLISLARVYRVEGKYPQSEQTLTKALALAEKNGDDALKAEVYNQMGSLYLRQGKQKDAFEKLEMACKLAKDNKAVDSVTYANMINNFGQALRRADKPDDAIKLYKEAIAISEKSGRGDNPETGNYWNNLANAQIDKKQLDDAENSLKKAINLRQKGAYPHVGLMSIYRRYGKLQRLKGNMSGADYYHQLARKVRRDLVRRGARNVPPVDEER
jgi:tetratricopeptide (TPR) repeat protein/tRNA A-37 threonylcarbamoyl transferase component Bud32